MEEGHAAVLAETQRLAEDASLQVSNYILHTVHLECTNA
jgi:hypothetical protein